MRERRATRPWKGWRTAGAAGEPRRESELALVCLRKTHHVHGEGISGGVGKEPCGHQRKHGQQRHSNSSLEKGVLDLWRSPTQVSENDKTQQQARHRARCKRFQNQEIHQPSPVEADARDNFRGERKSQTSPYGLCRKQPCPEDKKGRQYEPTPDSR